MTAVTNSSGKAGHGWQLILADLALIFFLLMLTALPAAEAENARPLADKAARGEDSQVPGTAEIAASQALYRPIAGGPSLAQWLAAQPRDPRATLTVFARFRQGEEARAWAEARALVEEAAGSGVTVRTIIAAGDEADLYASLAYDAAPKQAEP
jgi:hypothetical protein